MKIDPLSNAAREIAKWRQFFRTRGAAASQAPLHPDRKETNLDTVEWSKTQWSETRPDTLALSGPIDSTENQR